GRSACRRRQPKPDVMVIRRATADYRVCHDQAGCCLKTSRIVRSPRRRTKAVPPEKYGPQEARRLIRWLGGIFFSEDWALERSLFQSRHFGSYFLEMFV